ncbi:5-oxoprolinase subunit C family protein [Sporolactobacillus inulinus]|uniref:Allophanate hydrolase 2 subunit 2 n=2 Tax=Sporolactobacillus inulinus TaxID=2078 RepID=A0A4Y1Z7H0_9BACL|nr:biotin-dependent carboxyltransferase family protein [Sporolactobacillus inulinus]KLI01520.1 urea amidolyase [Sporolactobacillus inulinus CASD]GAY74945.1 allophanate hydrolase 2 subunit 2 [Sporolactobacillus inulinus]GEB77974.1 KipI antagonist [Sporolactobacillus inulinus]
MTLIVIQKGFASSVQDLGRCGYQRYGMIVGGAMDQPSAKLANWLTGNHESAAVIEFSFLGPSILFTEDTLFALTGAVCRPTLDGNSIGTGRPCLARAGQILVIGGMVYGSRGYLSVAGGVDTPLWFGSRSTYEKAGRGGFEGRLLKEHDRVPVGKPSEEMSRVMAGLAGSKRQTVRWSALPRRKYQETQTIRVMPDTLWPRFSAASREAFLKTEYQITPSSDRMGFRLNGAELMLDNPLELYSEAVTNGSIQVPRNGQPIILMTDHQSTGGYPRIAQVASADLPLLAQLPPGSTLRFQMISSEQGEAALVRQEEELEQLHRCIRVGIVKQITGFSD